MSENELTRRQVVSMAGLGSLAVAVGGPGAASAGSKLFSSRSKSVKGTFDDGTDEILGGLQGRRGRVIVVGAGMAGLAAANALRNAGVETVVLEGRSRTGGRTHTEKVGGTPVDLGASWINYPINNPMSAYAEQAGVNLVPASPELDAATVLLYDGKSGPVPNDSKFTAFMNALQFYERSRGIGRELGNRATLEDGAARFLDEIGLTGNDRRWASFFIQTYSELGFAKDWGTQPLNQPASTRPMPTPNHPSYDGFGMGDFPSGGYGRIVKSLASGSDIRRNHNVTEIKRSKGKVEVTAVVTKKGKKKKVIFEGTHVLVAVPLGVLKAHSIKFSPPLPKTKLGAVRRLGFGNVEKVAMTFERPFWQDQGTTHLLHVGKKDTGHFPMIIDLQRFVGKPTLVAFNAGAMARSLDGKKPQQVREEAMDVLRQVYGRRALKPEEVAVTNWLNDPFSRGSYSATVMKTKGDDRALLADPVGGRILFAGEATNYSGRASTADGAMSSGIREAKRILQTPGVQLGARSAR